MRLEVGKYYRTRSGEKVYVVYTSLADQESVAGVIKQHMYFWLPDGGYLPSGQQPDQDIIAEWVDPPKMRKMAPYLLTYSNGAVFQSLTWYETDDDCQSSFPDVTAVKRLTVLEEELPPKL